MSLFLYCCCVEAFLGVLFLSFIGVLLATGSHSIHTSYDGKGWMSPSLAFFIAAALNVGVFVFTMIRIKATQAKRLQEQEQARARLNTNRSYPSTGSNQQRGSTIL